LLTTPAFSVRIVFVGIHTQVNEQSKEIKGFIDLGADDAEERATLISQTGNEPPTPSTIVNTSPKKPGQRKIGKEGTLILNMTDRKRKGKTRPWEFKIPPAGTNFYQAVMDLANDFDVKKLYKVSGAGAQTAGITSPVVMRKGVAKAKGSIYRLSSTSSIGSTDSGANGPVERCTKCNLKKVFCMCGVSNEKRMGANPKKRLSKGPTGAASVEPTNAPAAPVAAEGEFVALSQRPTAIALKRKLDSQNDIGNVFDLPPEQWKMSFEAPIKKYIEGEILAAAYIPKELQKHLRLLEEHKPMYDQTMEDVRVDPVFPGMTDLLEGMRERVQARSAIEYAHNNGKPCQRTSDFLQLYNEGRQVDVLYTKLMENLARKSKCKYIPAENKGVIRCFEKMGLKIEKKWDASCLTDIVRGALEMPAVGKGRLALKTFQGFDHEESGEPTAFVSGGLTLQEQIELNIHIVDVKNRWNVPTDGGWCDALITFYFHADANKHICEMQVVHEDMMSIRSEYKAHRAYGVFRSALELLEATGASIVLEGAIAVASGGGVRHCLAKLASRRPATGCARTKHCVGALCGAPITPAKCRRAPAQSHQQPSCVTRTASSAEKNTVFCK
jgi:hypothetical protein